jgi:hypothetical protein
MTRIGNKDSFDGCNSFILTGGIIVVVILSMRAPPLHAHCPFFITVFAFHFPRPHRPRSPLLFLFAWMFQRRGCRASCHARETDAWTQLAAKEERRRRRLELLFVTQHTHALVNFSAHSDACAARSNLVLGGPPTAPAPPGPLRHDKWFVDILRPHVFGLYGAVCSPLQQ